MFAGSVMLTVEDLTNVCGDLADWNQASPTQTATESRNHFHLDRRYRRMSMTFNSCEVLLLFCIVYFFVLLTAQITEQIVVTKDVKRVTYWRVLSSRSFFLYLGST